MRHVSFLILFILFFSIGFSETYISEINFLGDEFVEIYSDSAIDLDGALVYDENGILKNNTLKLVNYVGSDYTLVIGENFMSNNNILAINCNVYVSDRSQVSNGGLKSGGEDFIISSLSGLNWSYDNLETWILEPGKSLHYDLNSNSYFVSDYSYCIESSLGSLEDEVVEVFEDEFPEEVLSEEVSCGDQEFFAIKVDSNIFFDKIKFSFESSLDDFEINYWVEDYSGEIIKKPIETTNLNEKSFTPTKITQVYRIVAQIDSESCSFTDEVLVTYYFENSSLDTGEEKTNFELSLTDSKLDYKIYRGDTLKRVVNILVNSKKVLSLNVDRFSKVYGRFDLEPYLDLGNNTILVYGLDYEKNLSIFVEGLDLEPEINESVSKDLKNYEISKSSKQFFEILNLTYTDLDILFNISSNIDDLTFDCHINIGRVRVSDEVFGNLSGQYSLVIDSDKFFDKSKFGEGILNLVCKYKKSFLKSYKYESYKFNFSYFEEIKQDELIVINSSNGEILGNFESNEISSEIVYSSKSSESSKKSVYFILVGVVSLVIMMLLFW